MDDVKPLRGQEEDPVISEYDVYISTQLSPYLHMIQVPRSSIEELEGRGNGAGVQNCRYKRQHKLLELHVPLDTTHSTFSRTRAAEFSTHSGTGRIRLHGTGGEGTAATTTGMGEGELLKTVKLAGGPMAANPNSRYFVATSMEGALHLTPISNFTLLKPSLPHLDEADARTRSAARKLAEPAATEGGGSGERLRALSVQFKKRETEEQMAARLSSYAYLQRQVENEPWIDMQYFFPSSPESATVFARLATVDRERAVHFEPVRKMT